MNKQQELWKGEFGDTYHQRNSEKDRYDFWYEVLRGYTMNIESVFEPGAGRGDNLNAIAQFPFGKRRLTGMDINESACKAMEARGLLAIQGAFPDFNINNQYDLVLTRGFLIHLPLDQVHLALDKIYEMSKRYICLAEYYSPTHRSVSYRNNRQAMWTGDFAGMMMQHYPGISLLRYGFKYWMEGGDDITYFLMEKPH